MKVKLLKKIRKHWFVSYNKNTVYMHGFFRFSFVRKDYSDYTNIDSITTINKFCLDNGLYNYEQYCAYEIKKRVRRNSSIFKA